MKYLLGNQVWAKAGCPARVASERGVNGPQTLPNSQVPGGADPAPAGRGRCQEPFVSPPPRAAAAASARPRLRWARDAGAARCPPARRGGERRRGPEHGGKDTGLRVGLEGAAPGEPEPRPPPAASGRAAGAGWSPRRARPLSTPTPARRGTGQPRSAAAARLGQEAVDLLLDLPRVQPGPGGLGRARAPLARGGLRSPAVPPPPREGAGTRGDAAAPGIRRAADGER